MNEGSERKRISINTDLFTTQPKKKNKTQKKMKPKKEMPSIKANSIKKALIHKIKQKQQKQERQSHESSSVKDATAQDGIKTDESDFENDFMKSMQFLDTMIKDKRAKKEKKRTMKKSKPAPSDVASSTGPMINIQTPQPSVSSIEPSALRIDPNASSIDPNASSIEPNALRIGPSVSSTDANPLRIDAIAQNTNASTKDPLLLLPEPQYGCLKNGAKPCYRTFHNKTLKKMPYVTPKKGPRKTKIRKRCIRKSKYRVGKTAKNRTISVLITNNQTRRRVQKDIMDLKRKPISEIKKELYKQNLLKVGTLCPPDVIRTIYENSMLAGQVKNSGKGVSIHNFVSEDD